MASFLYNLGTIAIYVFILSSMFLTADGDCRGSCCAITQPVAPHPLALCKFHPRSPDRHHHDHPYPHEPGGGPAPREHRCRCSSTVKVAQFTGGNVAQAVSLTIIMTIVTVVLMPFLIPFILEGAQADPLSVMANLVVMILIPLVLGIIIKSRTEPLAARIRPVMDWASNISIAVIFLTFGIIFLSRLRDIVSTSSAPSRSLWPLFSPCSLWVPRTWSGGSKRMPGRTLSSAPAPEQHRRPGGGLCVFTSIQNDVLLVVLMVTIFAIIIVSILVGIIFKKRMDAEKKAKGSGA